MKWSHTLIAGAVLILLTNAVALLGAAYNRSDDPESQLRLSQRELQNSRWNAKDNSGITLTLNWRVAQTQKENHGMGYYAGRWGTPAWLNKAKLSELGYDVDRLASNASDGRRHKETQSREVLLVLELNGQAYVQELQRSQEYAEQSRKLLEGNPGSDEFKRRAKNAAESYKNEQQLNSRLFVIDAGVDLSRLRAAYPDRSRYAIVHGLIRQNYYVEKDGESVGGYVSELHADRINVPLSYRPVFESSSPFEVTVAFGKRLEPWVTAAAKGVAVR